MHRVTGPPGGLPHVVGKVGKWTWSQLKKGLNFLKSLVLLITGWFTGGILKIGQFVKFIGTQF